MLTDLTKPIGDDRPTNGLGKTLLIDPYTRRPYSLGAMGRYTAPTGKSFFIQNQPFSAADNTTTEIIAAVPNYRIVVVGYIVQSGATAQTITFKSASDAVSHIMQNGAYGGCTRPVLTGGEYFSTLGGEALNATTSSASGAVTTGSIDYALVPDSSIVDENGDPLVDEDGNPISG